MIYTVGEMAQKLAYLPPPCATTTKKSYFPLWSVPPAEFGCSGKPTSSGCRSSADEKAGMSIKDIRQYIELSMQGAELRSLMYEKRSYSVFQSCKVVNFQ